MNDQLHHVTLNFADGVTHSFSVPRGANILDAAIEAEMPVLYQCRSGSCSSCICNLADGDAATLPGASSTLLASEYEAGQRLLCVSQARSDCTFNLGYGSEVGASAAHEVHAFIDSVERIASNVVKLTLELAEGEWMEFRPGQFMQIVVPGLGVLRSYSPSSTQVDLPKMEFLIRLLPGGAMSGFLEHEAETDQVLTLSGPYGAFFLREESRRAPHIFVAGGTGLAPILSMIDTLRQGGGRKPPMLLSFGCAVPEALFSLEDIELRQQWLPTLETRICVDREATEGLHLGSPVSALREGDVTSPDTVAYLCGPQPMIDAATARLIELGVKPENIFAEQFVASN
ncbi:ring-hydroxylating dioxygenase ferredoxin reductase family protein [Pseudomonas saudiphocaensis]|uniref:ring-hydroxylating dioxygenase ferredoxin reductase family protein n=1 Tax=Pseudomonas saudiphocaensis TaxID=1499686 RepID=UPI00187D3EA8|nr:ring-hydroxylating dioxygenase ferredoxin reductase family protein [Pseudomonas saudiphocaensis]MBE7928890.1 ring-hydroxylating dioxygenase ferredoxin reductase family protein [Pseudomonas saudiphocaensis]